MYLHDNKIHIVKIYLLTPYAIHRKDLVEHVS